MGYFIRIALLDRQICIGYYFGTFKTGRGTSDQQSPLERQLNFDNRRVTMKKNRVFDS